MSESAGNTAPSSPAPSLKKKGGKSWMIIAVVIVIVVALVAVVVLGGFLNKNEDTSANLLEKIKKRGYIIVGTQVPYPPFEDYNITTKTFQGIDIEIITMIAERLGVGIQFKSMDFDPLFGAVQSGVIDCAISSITITDERNQSNAFSIPYYTANQAVLVKESSTIHNIDGLNGTKVVAQTGTTGEYWAEDNLVKTGRISSGSFTTMADVPQAALTVENGQNDVFIVDTPVANKYANDPSMNLKVGYVIYTNENYGIMMPLDQPEFRAAVNGILTDMIDYGTIESIVSYWLNG